VISFQLLDDMVAGGCRIGASRYRAVTESLDIIFLDKRFSRPHHNRVFLFFVAASPPVQFFDVIMCSTSAVEASSALKNHTLAPNYGTMLNFFGKFKRNLRELH
jgi:hypothetical protein